MTGTKSDVAETSDSQTVINDFNTTLLISLLNSLLKKCKCMTTNFKKLVPTHIFLLQFGNLISEKKEKIKW